MCRFASFMHHPVTGEIKVHDLESHSQTEEALKLDKRVWREGHYLPGGTLEARVAPDNRISTQEATERVRMRFPSFGDFISWSITELTVDGRYPGNLDLRGCDLKGITLPQSVGGNLDLRGCDLKGITIPRALARKVIK